MTAEHEIEAVVNWLRKTSAKFKPNERAKVVDVLAMAELSLRRGDHHQHTDRG